MNPAYRSFSAGQDRHLDPPDEPMLENSDEYLSTCCGANSSIVVIDGQGICSWCGNRATFKDERGNFSDSNEYHISTSAITYWMPLPVPPVELKEEEL